MNKTATVNNIVIEETTENGEVVVRVNGKRWDGSFEDAVDTLTSLNAQSSGGGDG